MRIIGYGICGPGEASRYMRETLEEFKRLCDEVIICVNGGPQGSCYDEIKLIEEYGFKWTIDTRIWGHVQWQIKQDFLKDHVSKITKEGDMMVCLDMDETLDRKLTREWILSAELDAYHVFVVDLWNDRQHYKPKSCFWNVRIWRWNGIVEFAQKPVHCGLAPAWAYKYHRFAPFLLLHKGLMDPESRRRKIARYEKYDPNAKHLDRRYYRMLHEDTADPFDEEALHATIANEVATYQQTKPRNPIPAMAQPRGRFGYVKNPAGHTVDIPEKQLAETLKRPGFTFIGWADDAQEEMQELFKDENVEDSVRGSAPADVSPPRPEGSYVRSAEDEKQEVDTRNAADDEKLAAGKKKTITKTKKK